MNTKQIEKDLEKLFVSVKNLEYKNNWVTVYINENKKGD